MIYEGIENGKEVIVKLNFEQKLFLTIENMNMLKQRGFPLYYYHTDFIKDIQDDIEPVNF